MISVEEAEKILSENYRDFGTEKIPIEKSVGRIIREDIIADRDFPPFDRVTMDGIAIRYNAIEKGEKDFSIRGAAAAGDPQKSLREKGACLEVMTGAIMPDGLDTVVPYEKIEIREGKAYLKTEEIKYKQNIHFRVEDRRKGDVLIKSGMKISAAEIGLCATVGKSVVKVSRLPKTIIISTGKELVGINDKPEAHQIRESNVYAIQALLKKVQIEANTMHLPDDYDTIIKILKELLNEFEIIILSGGVSKGKFDFIPNALEELGLKKCFHRIAQRPGKPFWFGTLENKVSVFALPGNPVSSFLCINYYFFDWLNGSIEAYKNQRPLAKLGRDIEFKADLTYFLEVNLEYTEKAELIAFPNKGNGSGDLANLTNNSAFTILPRGREIYKKGEVFPVLIYR
ncbi:molybdopterin molybdotransferase MoeA [Hyphobacterium sp. CCMP332]|nr:molybdopterin molybdotransferase MoeA [Hyphobacterium sp. CCMP332]